MVNESLLRKARDMAAHIEQAVYIYEIDDERVGGRKQFISTRPDLEGDDESVAFDIKLLRWVSAEGDIES